MCSHEVKPEAVELLADLLREMAQALAPGEPVVIGPVDFGGSS